MKDVEKEACDKCAREVRTSTKQSVIIKPIRSRRQNMLNEWIGTVQSGEFTKVD